MATYTVTCRGRLPRGVITQLTNGGFYLYEESELGFETEGVKRHFLKVEAGSADDAILVAKGAMAVSGGEARDYQATDGVPPDEGAPPA